MPDLPLVIHAKENKMKTCTKCGETKALEEFYSGRAQCKPCVIRRTTAYYQEHRDKRLDDMRVYSQKHYAQNREEYRERNKAWAEANPEKMREYSRASKRRHYNTDANRAQGLRRRARKADNGVYLVTDRDYRRILESPCVACGSTKNIQVDHIIPIARGGRHCVGNLQALCGSCNASKGAKLPIAWRISYSASGTPHAQGGRP